MGGGECVCVCVWGGGGRGRGGEGKSKAGKRANPSEILESAKDAAFHDLFKRTSVHKKNICINRILDIMIQFCLQWPVRWKLLTLKDI